MRGHQNIVLFRAGGPARASTSLAAFSFIMSDTAHQEQQIATSNDDESGQLIRRRLDESTTTRVTELAVNLVKKGADFQHTQTITKQGEQHVIETVLKHPGA